MYSTAVQALKTKEGAQYHNLDTRLIIIQFSSILVTNDLAYMHSITITYKSHPRYHYLKFYLLQAVHYSPTPTLKKKKKKKKKIKVRHNSILIKQMLYTNSTRTCLHQRKKKEKRKNRINATEVTL